MSVITERERGHFVGWAFDLYVYIYIVENARLDLVAMKTYAYSIYTYIYIYRERVENAHHGLVFNM